MLKAMMGSHRIPGPHEDLRPSAAFPRSEPLPDLRRCSTERLRDQIRRKNGDDSGRRSTVKRRLRENAFVCPSLDDSLNSADETVGSAYTSDEDDEDAWDSVGMVED